MLGRKNLAGAWCGLLMALLAIGPLASCRSSQPAPTPEATQPTSELNIYNWDTYIDPAILAGFEQTFGVTVHYTTYSGNEEMLATLQAHPAAYDVIVPSHYFVAAMRKEGLLAPLDKSNIPNFENVDPAFVNPWFDPGNRYCVPYQWGTMGIGYNIEATGKELGGWKDMFDPAYAGRVALLDDPRATMAAILLYLGYSPNTSSEVEIAAARDFLISHSKTVATYAPDTGQDLLAEGAVDIALEWSGDIFQIMQDSPDIRYIVPGEGSVLWTDNLCIPAQSPHKELAEVFINYILDPQVGAALSNYTHFSSPNQAALPMINEADRTNPGLYPPDEVRKRLFFAVDVGPETTQLYERAWAEIMAKHKP